MYRCRLPLSKWCLTTAFASPLLESALRQYRESLPYVFPSTTTSRSGHREWDRTYGAFRDLGGKEWTVDLVGNEQYTCDFPSRACTCRDTQWLGFGRGWSCLLSEPSGHCPEVTRYTWWGFSKSTELTKLSKMRNSCLLSDCCVLVWKSSKGALNILNMVRWILAVNECQCW